MVTTLWQSLRQEAERITHKEPLLASYIYACILNHKDYASALSFLLANKLSDDVMPAIALRELFDDAYRTDDSIIVAAAEDLKAVFNRDPAIHTYSEVLLNLKGFQSIQTHRLAHYLWQQGRKELALFIQSLNSGAFGVDIHPACRLGKGVMFDHATGIVIGETAVIEDNVSIMQSVTLGGTGNECGDRHPKIRSGVLIGASATVLGNIEIGEGSKIGAGSVVLSEVQAHTTVAGVPAKLVGRPACSCPSESMEQNVFKDKAVPLEEVG